MPDVLVGVHGLYVSSTRGILLILSVLTMGGCSPKPVDPNGPGGVNASLRGRIEAVDLSKWELEIQTPEGERQVALNRDTKVRLHGLEVSLASLKAGQEAQFAIAGPAKRGGAMAAVINILGFDAKTADAVKKAPVEKPH